MYVFEHMHLYLMKNIENWLSIYWSNFFPYRPSVPQLHRDLTAQLSSAPLSFPSTCLGLGRKITMPQEVPAHMLPCLSCVQMDFLSYGRWKEELQDITSGSASPTHNMPQPKLQTLTQFSSHLCQHKIYIKLSPCMQKDLGSWGNGPGKMKKI